MMKPRFPMEVTLRNGATIAIREMLPEDEEKSFEFFKTLPEDERQYLRMDVTVLENIRRRMKTSGFQRCWRLIAETDDKIIADATLCGPAVGWMRHVSEIRSIIHPDYKRKGLGSILITELFQKAVADNVDFVFCEVMSAQKSAITALEKIGFTRELVRSNHVKDIHGVKHDLYIYVKDVHEMWDTLKNHMLEYDIPYRPE
ncbi:GNAT family N-acetyltransferase [Acidobacteriota bacterium]